MGNAAGEFDAFDTLVVSPELQASVDLMQQAGLDDQQILAELIRALAAGSDAARASCGTLAPPH